MRTIRLYGRLAKFLGRRKFVADVANAAEAVRFLLANFPHLQEHMADQHYKVRVGDREIGEEELGEPSSNSEEITVVPVIAGAGTVGRIIAGVALIALSFIPGFAAWAGPTAYALIIGTGASLVLGGVAQLLTPVPNVPSGANSDDDPRKSYSFSGIQNVSRQGVPVPIVYGEVLVGSVVISAGIDIDQVAA
jgi:predicted phage tail protein